MSDLVSIVIPTYNREKSISKSIDSILNQTYKGFEIIIVDDNSTDNTEQLIKEYMSKYGNILYFKHDTNKGGSAARNTGIKMAKGNFIAFLDSDDDWISNKLEKEMEMFKKHPEIDLIYSQMNLIDVENNSAKIYRQEYFEDKYYGMLCKNIIGSTSLIILRKHVLDEVKGFNEKLPSCQDWDFYLSIAEKYNIEMISEPLLNYYIHGNSISGSLDRVIAGHKIMLERVKKIIDNNSDYYRYRKKIISMHYLNFGYIYLRFKDFKKARYYFKKAFILNPFNSKISKNFIASLLGKKIYFKLKK